MLVFRNLNKSQVHLTNENILKTMFCSQDTGVDKREDEYNIKEFLLQHYYIHSKSAEVWIIIKNKDTAQKEKINDKQILSFVSYINEHIC